MKANDLERGMIIAATIVDSHANMYRKDGTEGHAVVLSSAAAFIEEAFLERAEQRGWARDDAQQYFRLCNYQHPGHEAAKQKQREPAT